MVASLAALVLFGALLAPWLQGLFTSPAGPTPTTAVSRNASPGVDGIIARSVPPEQLEPGDCLTDFRSVEETATVIDCQSPHTAQLIGRKTWPDQAAFPTEGLRGAAEEFCGQIQLTGSPEAQIRIEISHPAEGTWAEGDRRVDCVAHALQGTLTTSLTTDPVAEGPSSAPSATNSPAATSSPTP